MIAVVLVGGMGTRLRPLTLTTPKPLLPIGHVPMVERVLANLARGGITGVVLSLGFRPDAFREAYPDGRCAGLDMQYAVEPEPLDTAGAIRFAARHAGIDETFVVVNGDVLTDLDVGRLVAAHREMEAEASIHLTPVEDPSAFGVVPTDADGWVTAFIEKPPAGEAPTNLINAGTYVLEPTVLERIPADRRVSIERETFPAIVEDRRLFAMATTDYWLDTGRPDQFIQGNLDVLEGRRRDTCSPLGEGAMVDRTAVVSRSIVGRDGRVAAGAEISRSVLLPGVAVGEGATIRDSVLGAGARVGKKALLDRVVLGDGIEVEDASRLDTVRVPAPA
jgi:mannose-1-phosphate guanylyltransferase